VTVKNSVFWDMTSCGIWKNRHFGGAYRLHRQHFTQCASVAISVVPNLLILFTLMINSISSVETSVLTRAIRHHITADGILHNQICLNAFRLMQTVYYFKISNCSSYFVEEKRKKHLSDIFSVHVDLVMETNCGLNIHFMATTLTFV
jgi:hypothetical protein